MLELGSDFRYIALFVLVLIPLVIAFQENQLRRGWTLAWLGNLVIFLTLMLPAIAGSELLVGAEGFFDEGTRISNPRVLTSGGMALGLLGGYIILFSGLIDLREANVSRTARLGMGGLAIGLVLFLLFTGGVDTYSILVEFYQRGETLGARFVEHFVFVLVSLIAGMIVGIGLGLWASRDDRVEPIILNAVGIIQTIPSLALFGVLLVPLARLGDQQFLSVLQIFLLLTAVSVVVLGAFFFLQSRLPDRIRSVWLIGGTFLSFIPLALFMIVVITFGFQSVLRVFRNPDLTSVALIALVVPLIALPILSNYNRRSDDSKFSRRILYAQIVVSVVSTGVFLFTLGVAGNQLIGDRTLQELTIRNLGVSGIGTAPAIIALTLYSLLPLVRNTFAGLNNIDPAIIDSGRGMGMTPAQIFFRIELPLAFPVIMAGVRNAGISLVGIAAVASIIGAGALGDFILLGVNSTSIDLILLGALPAVLLAVLLDILLQLFEAAFTSPGIRRVTQ